MGLMSKIHQAFQGRKVGDGPSMPKGREGPVPPESSPSSSFSTEEKQLGDKTASAWTPPASEAPPPANFNANPTGSGSPGGPPPPGHQMHQTLGNAGMQVGMADSMFNPNGPNMGAGMVDGMVVGGIIGQRVDQAQSHAYWKDKQAEFMAGNEAAVVNTGVPRTERELRREERRRSRWSRRAT